MFRIFHRLCQRLWLTKKKKFNFSVVFKDPSNVIEYKLSDRRFLDIGWTVKPSARIARRIIQYETKMAKPHMNWFHLYRHAGTRYYDDLRTPFVRFNPDSSGQVFYPNGAVAIAVKRPEKRLYNMYTVFTPGGRDSLGRRLEPQMLAVFDGLGNGIVINEDNNTRLTYNQMGGIYLDNKMPYVWTWSRKGIEPKMGAGTDNEIHPARLQKLLQKLAVRSTKSSAESKTPKSGKAAGKMGTPRPRGENITAEDTVNVLDSNNIEKPTKEILAALKIICLRLNSHLSLRILDRHNISLRFSSCRKSIRMELGTMLNLEKPIRSYTMHTSEGLRGMLKSRFEIENLDDSINPDDSLYDIAKEYRRIEENKRKRRQSLTSETFLPNEE